VDAVGDVAQIRWLMIGAKAGDGEAEQMEKSSLSTTTLFDTASSRIFAYFVVVHPLGPWPKWNRLIIPFTALP
jgi:hypothetical protein